MRRWTSGAVTGIVMLAVIVTDLHVGIVGDPIQMVAQCWKWRQQHRSAASGMTEQPFFVITLLTSHEEGAIKSARKIVCFH